MRSLELGIVGHEQAKFTPHTEALAREAIELAIDTFEPDAIVSGRCPLGGVDIYAEEAAAARGIEMIVHALKIARESDLVLCIALRRLPPSFTGMRFDACYHCAGRNPEHVKGGGCWTAWRCAERVWVIL